MSCSNCGTGSFNSNVFTPVPAIPIVLANGTTLTRGSDQSSLTVSKQGHSIPFIGPQNGQATFCTWGDNYLAVMTRDGFTGSEVSINIIDTTVSPIALHGVVFTTSMPSDSSPAISTCPGDGAIVAIVTSRSVGTVSASLFQSRNGSSVATAVDFVPSLQVSANATATHLQILHGTEVQFSVLKPKAISVVSPLNAGRVRFGEAVTGQGTTAAQSTKTKPVTIKNTGNNCLQINQLVDSAHFKVQMASLSRPLPARLDASETLTFDVKFDPGNVASLITFDETIAISPQPESINTRIDCNGTARPAKRTIGYSNINFGSVLVGDDPTRTLQITNTGDVPVTINFPAPSLGSAFTWVAPSLGTQINAGASLSIQIKFSPTAVTSYSLPVVFDASTAAGIHQVTLTGAGCSPKPSMQVPAVAPISFGQIQQGFRTIRSFKVANTGNGPLVFSARIVAAIPADSQSETEAGLFGLMEQTGALLLMQSATLENLSVLPVSNCGPGQNGSGELLIGVVFNANHSANAVSAVLELYDHNDSTLSAVMRYQLLAEITNPVSVDMEIVLDRSGSMNESSGSRKKIDTALDAARLFASLFRSDVSDRLGLVRYNDVPEVVTVDGQSITALTASNRTNFLDVLSLTNFSPFGNTCIAGGILVAQNSIRSNPRVVPADLLNKVVLVLTDGKDNAPYLNPDDGRYYSLLGGPGFDLSTGFHDTVALPVPGDIKIYAVGIGDNIDNGRLSVIATSSGGAYLHAREFQGQDYFNLEKHFTQVFMEAVNYAVISDPVFTIGPQQQHDFQFEVLEGDKSALIVMYDKDHIRIPFYIRTPGGIEIDVTTVPVDFAIRAGISPTARFVEILMPADKPEIYAGTWTVIVKHLGSACVANEAFVYSQKERDSIQQLEKYYETGFKPKSCKEEFGLNVLYGIAIGVNSEFSFIPFVTPGIVKTGEMIQLTASVEQFGGPVRNCQIKVVAQKPNGRTSVHYMADDGQHGDDQSNDGFYGLPFLGTDQSGTYTFTFTCYGQSRDGKPVQREAVRSKYVEGTEPLIPGKDSYPITPVDTEDCCRKNSRILNLIALLLTIILAILLYLILK
ncbi:choice-of-anchor D domain-containing protein [Dyadobacter sp. CY261]|uniref:choice-of-anchor D domain-containing protein n=1 Tax=Dyadobacter sp. CY261 TaxID=2907203 RepID=UPI001F16EC12|nr:choice-of-anchor D domain-containing protein [Dyadobacter sp. CY261]MCF0075195.1 choice-of-anchor D domain-containing protein [Dyadobacter sp. CY261]